MAYSLTILAKNGECHQYQNLSQGDAIWKAHEFLAKDFVLLVYVVNSETGVYELLKSNVSALFDEWCKEMNEYVLKNKLTLTETQYMVKPLMFDPKGR